MCIKLVIFITVLRLISKDITLSHCGLLILNSDIFFFFAALENLTHC